ncbi:RagB/SusD family nutrient uptake outer membrane protein [Flavisolibacter nicotianae]|uniref:RagB/SusD family nutrient uptake outer membrane protein n=1 Tax=Flavisolibacter nicotianae TaxID=2364882 RepID=UPI000EAC8B13|nr:RagB/SusD family nutrient uptake outer membrane protein [Flavisolibacter nicotianae]
MRNTVKYIQVAGFCATILATVVGCKKSYLAPEPLSFYEPSATYVDAAAMRSALASCNRNLRQEFYGGNPPILTEMLFSEIAVEGTTDKSGPAVDLNLLITPDLVQFNDDDHNKIYVYWTEGYNAIKYANTIISRIDQATFSSPAERNAILGAAYFHRALRYYRLVHQFGDVPAIMKEITAPKLDFYSTKREVILQKIKTDLDSALLWTSDNVNKGEVTKGAVAHLLTKVNLALGNFDAAITAANSVINSSPYSLMRAPFGNAAPPVEFIEGSPTPVALPHNVIWDLHRPENKSLATNKEGLFMIIDRFGDGQFGTGMTIMRQAVAFWGTNVNAPSGKKGTYDNLTAEFVQSNYVGRGIGRSRPSNYAQYEIWDDPNDLRHAKGNWMRMEDLLYNDPGLKSTNDPNYLKHVRLRNSSGGLLCTDTIRSYFGWPQYKLFVPDFENSPMQGGHSDWYMFRLAETYLLRAEAYFWKGELGLAAADINEVRTRAGCAPITAADVNMGTILDERARELFFEEPRKTELTRISYLFAKTGIAAENGKTYTLNSFSDNNYFYDRIIAKNNFYRLGIVTNHADKYTISPYHVLWPIPTRSINGNTNGRINQNKGYVGYENNVAPLDKIVD